MQFFSPDTNKKTGDTFTGAYASEYLRQKTDRKWDIRSAIVRANKAVAITTQSLGARQGIPWADEIDASEAPLKKIADVTRSSSSHSLSISFSKETEDREAKRSRRAKKSNKRKRKIAIFVPGVLPRVIYITQNS
jgi:hypothetical protein